MTTQSANQESNFNKKLFIVILILFIGLVCTRKAMAQSKVSVDNIKIENNVITKTTLKTDTIEITGYWYTDRYGELYEVFVGRKGSYYIVRTSKKTGNTYRYYLPKDVVEAIKTDIETKKLLAK